MKSSRIEVWLSWLIAVLAFVAAGVGLFYQDGGSSYAFTTQRGQLRGGLLLTGVLAYFLYSYGSMAFGAAYNPLFLVYIVLFSASLFAFVISLTSFDVPELPTHFSSGLPRRSIGVFLVVSGGILALVWLALSLVPALLSGTAPLEVASYTTFITAAIDIGIVAPALIVSGALLLRNAPIGYLLSSTMLVFAVTLGTSLLMAGIAQVLTGVVTIGQFMWFTVPFVILTLIAFGFTKILFRKCSDVAIGKTVSAQVAHV